LDILFAGVHPLPKVISELILSDGLDNPGTTSGLPIPILFSGIKKKSSGAKFGK
jgi:hypothetical protein